jgi:quinoprotein glucose dehydrogenase
MEVRYPRQLWKNRLVRLDRFVGWRETVVSGLLRRMRVLLSLLFASMLPVGKACAGTGIFERTNLVAWCVVPFDGKKRGPAERASMLARIGLTRCAYDWRQEHVGEFEEEILQYKKHGIEYFAFWGGHPEAFKLFAKHGMRPQIWRTLISPKADTQEARVKLAAESLLGLVEETRKLGSRLGLYNHGGWGGEPENLVAVCEYLHRHHDAKHVGIIYNLHHGHDHIDDFAEVLARMLPHLLCFNLNGMNAGAEPKILQLGQGRFELRMLRTLRDSGYSGPVGILGHTQDDVEERLLDNLDGLDWLLPQLDGKPAGAKPIPRTAQEPLKKSAQVGADGGLLLEGRPQYRSRPFTVECRARLDSKRGFNILVASDTKASAEHWELYSYRGSGVLSLYQAGRGGEFRSAVDVCDGESHVLRAIVEPGRVRLFVDGKQVLDRPASAIQGTPLPGGFAIGRLVEGRLGCDGEVSEVRLSQGVREMAVAPDKPFEKDAMTLGLWRLSQLPRQHESEGLNRVEDAAARAALPEFRQTPAAAPSELTPANGSRLGSADNWTRSHGGDECLRYSTLDQINRDNVKGLEMAWSYHSRDGRGNIQCNPIVVDGVLYAPTVGDYLVAVDAATGREIWRFKPDKRPAFRGITHWPGGYGAAARLFFATENRSLYALDPKTGRPDPSFGEAGVVKLPEGARVAPVIFERTLVIAGYLKDVHAFDVVTGKPSWTFHTVPHPGEFGHETWERSSANAANCWGGMALDPKRGIAYITTGSPKPNFLGMEHHGDNLFANCVVAIDARNGERLWHFQEIPHDIWDLDIPAPPILTTITRGGRRIDVVAAVSKTGNTLLLDRVSGKAVFPMRWRRAPVSEVPGEVTAPYQLDLELPEPFSRQEFTREDLPTWKEDVFEWATNHLASARSGRFLPISDRKVTVFFGVHGGAEWTGACADPRNGRLYVSANEIPWLMSLVNWNEPERDPKAPPTRGQVVFNAACAQCHGTNRLGVGVAPPLLGLNRRLQDADVISLLKTGRGLMPVAPEMSDGDLQALLDFLFVRDVAADPAAKVDTSRPRYTQNKWSRFLDPEGYPGCNPPWGTLNCIDLNSGRILWKTPLGEYDELTKRGVPKTGTENFGGAITTAGGLVFCAGTRDEKIRAFDSDSGEELWSAKLPWGGYAPPLTYSVRGRQYVVIPATGGGKLGGPTGDAYVAFALPPAGE